MSKLNPELKITEADSDKLKELLNLIESPANLLSYFIRCEAPFASSLHAFIIEQAKNQLEGRSNSAERDEKLLKMFEDQKEQVDQKGIHLHRHGLFRIVHGLLTLNEKQITTGLEQELNAISIIALFDLNLISLNKRSTLEMRAISNPDEPNQNQPAPTKNRETTTQEVTVIIDKSPITAS